MGAPLAATKFLKHQTGRVFTTYWWGDYMIYEGIPVFVDGRTDMYFGTDILETYVNVASIVVNPDPVFKRWDVRWVLWNTGYGSRRVPVGRPSLEGRLPLGRRCSLRAHRLLVNPVAVAAWVLGRIGRFARSRTKRCEAGRTELAGK